MADTAPGGMVGEMSAPDDLTQGDVADKDTADNQAKNRP